MKASSFLLFRVFWLELLFLFMKKTNKNSTLVKLQSIHFKLEGPTYDRMAVHVSCIYNYLCNQYLSPLTL